MEAAVAEVDLPTTTGEAAGEVVEAGAVPGSPEEGGNDAMRVSAVQNTSERRENNIRSRSETQTAELAAEAVLAVVEAAEPHHSRTSHSAHEPLAFLLLSAVGAVAAAEDPSSSPAGVADEGEGARRPRRRRAEGDEGRYGFER